MHAEILFGWAGSWLVICVNNSRTVYEDECENGIERYITGNLQNLHDMVKLGIIFIDTADTFNALG